jgi:hypothetical protein
MDIVQQRGSGSEPEEPLPFPDEATPEDMQAELKEVATNHLIQACLANGFAQSEVAALYAAIQQRHLHAHLICADEGRPFWCIERVGVWPPENWTLVHWLAKHRAEVRTHA